MTTVEGTRFTRKNTTLVGAVTSMRMVDDMIMMKDFTITDMAAIGGITETIHLIPTMIHECSTSSKIPGTHRLAMSMGTSMNMSIPITLNMTRLNISRLNINHLNIHLSIHLSISRLNIKIYSMQRSITVSSINWNKKGTRNRSMQLRTSTPRLLPSMESRTTLRSARRLWTLHTRSFPSELSTCSMSLLPTMTSRCMESTLPTTSSNQVLRMSKRTAALSCNNTMGDNRTNLKILPGLQLRSLPHRLLVKLQSYTLSRICEPRLGLEDNLSLCCQTTPKPSNQLWLKYAH